jgi:hypothetical protein
MTSLKPQTIQKPIWLMDYEHAMMTNPDQRHYNLAVEVSSVARQTNSFAFYMNGVVFEDPIMLAGIHPPHAHLGVPVAQWLATKTTWLAARLAAPGQPAPAAGPPGKFTQPAAASTSAAAAAAAQPDAKSTEQPAEDDEAWEEEEDWTEKPKDDAWKNWSGGAWKSGSSWNSQKPRAWGDSKGGASHRESKKEWLEQQRAEVAEQLRHRVLTNELPSAVDPGLWARVGAPPGTVKEGAARLAQDVGAFQPWFRWAAEHVTPSQQLGHDTVRRHSIFLVDTQDEPVASNVPGRMLSPFQGLHPVQSWQLREAKKNRAAAESWSPPQDNGLYVNLFLNKTLRDIKVQLALSIDYPHICGSAQYESYFMDQMNSPELGGLWFPEMGGSDSTVYLAVKLHLVRLSAGQLEDWPLCDLTLQAHRGLEEMSVDQHLWQLEQVMWMHQHPQEWQLRVQIRIFSDKRVFAYRTSTFGRLYMATEGGRVIEAGLPRIMLEVRTTPPNSWSALGTDGDRVELTLQDGFNHLKLRCKQIAVSTDCLVLSRVSFGEINRIIPEARRLGARVDCPDPLLSPSQLAELHRQWLADSVAPPAAALPDDELEAFRYQCAKWLVMDTKSADATHVQLVQAMAQAPAFRVVETVRMLRPGAERGQLPHEVATDHPTLTADGDGSSSAAAAVAADPAVVHVSAAVPKAPQPGPADMSALLTRPSRAVAPTRHLVGNGQMLIEEIHDETFDTLPEAAPRGGPTALSPPSPQQL